jgi:hypothetical protein
MAMAPIAAVIAWFTRAASAADVLINEPANARLLIDRFGNAAWVATNEVDAFLHPQQHRRALGATAPQQVMNAIHPLDGGEFIEHKPNPTL